MRGQQCPSKDLSGPDNSAARGDQTSFAYIRDTDLRIIDSNAIHPYFNIEEWYNTAGWSI